MEQVGLIRAAINEKEQSYSSDLNIQHVFLWYMEEREEPKVRLRSNDRRFFPVPRWYTYIKWIHLCCAHVLKNVVTVAVATYFVDNLFIYFRKTTLTCQCRKWPKSARTSIKSYQRSARPNSSPGEAEVGFFKKKSRILLNKVRPAYT